ncbi:MAG: hypothetical protein EKK48_05340 [Candidatus Melainabacteria bacterium]|nr:MAG: hypothetical protein EKK48_05340 [Candidatus Melainabacteria bacterium]
MRKKSVLALLFAGGLLSSKHPALSADYRSTEGHKDNGVVQSVAEDSQLPPELRAYFLLQLVEGLIDRRSSIGEKKFEYKVQVSQSWWLSKKQTALRDFLQRVARSEQLEQKNPSSNPIPAATKKFAQSMITKALAELDSSSDDFCKLNFYFIASNQFKIFGDQSGYLKYKKIVDDAIHSCEADNSTANDNTILAAAAILDAMAYAIIPVNIPDRFDLKNSEKVDFTEQEYSESRKLKQRSNAILDHLKSDNHNRRKAHRDLALWYLVLQKDQESEAEKKVLFDLVGIHDDRLLFPTSGGCGHVVWWVVDVKEQVGYDCGMG